ncbi:MAG TPA: TrmH family RNA methyltransferase [Caulobacteraceae bacterium]|nr:TrmH family RNA methyltransferase [Caulobacteraceae bacterium]
MRLALFQPDIPQNLGGAIRLCACMAATLEIIEPCGFPLSDRLARRAALDYAALARVIRHDSWARFRDADARREGRLILFTTRASTRFVDFAFAPGDTLLFGRESAGAPEAVHAAAEARLLIPLAPGARSLNVVAAAAMALGEALRQTSGFPEAVKADEAET